MGGLVPRGEKEREKGEFSRKADRVAFPCLAAKKKKNRERRKAKNEEGKIDGVDGSLAP